MTEQLNILGDQAQPGDEELGVTQRAVIRVLRRVGSMTVDEAGAIAHAGRQRHSVDERCRWCGVDGRPILDALVARGAARKTGGVYALPAAETPAAAPAALPDGYLSEFGF